MRQKSTKNSWILLMVLLSFRSVFSQCNIPSLLPNPDFESYSVCPTSNDELHKATGWSALSDAAADYYNCTYTNNPVSYAPPPPQTSGTGYISLFNNSTGQKQYASACLTSPLVAGTPYFFQFDIAAAQGGTGSSFNGMTSTLSYTIVLYGATACPLPPISGTGCPTPADGWQPLATATITTSGTEWTTHTLTFTPSANITGIAFGSDCTVASGNSGLCFGFCYNNYYFDNLILNSYDLYPNIDAGQDVTNDCITPTNVLGASVNGGTPNYTYAWEPSQGLNDTTLASPLADPSATTQYIVTVTDGNGCEDKDTIVVTVDKTPPPANAGPDKTIDCDNPQVMLDGSGGVTYSWSPATGLSSTTIATPMASPTDTTDYILTTIGDNGCTNEDTMTVFVDMDMPVVTTGPNVTTSCTTPDAQLQASGGVTYSWSPDFALTDANIANPLARPPYTTTYTVTVTGANGCQATGSTTVTINDVTPLALAGNDIRICGGTYSTTLQADTSVNLPTDVMQWTIDLAYNPNSANVVIADPTSPVSSISGFQEGAYRLFWTVTTPTSPCPPDVDTLMIYVYDPPTSNAGTDTSLCAVYELDLNGSSPVGTATGLWYLDPSYLNPSPVTFSDNTSPTTHISGLQEGTYRLIWRVSNGSCAPARDTILIEVADMPVANAGVDIDLCNVYTTSLGATLPQGTAMGTWSEASNYTNPSAVNFSGVNIPSSPISNLQEGTYHLVWTVVNGVCPDSTDTVKVNVYDPPVANAGSDVSICGVDSLYLDTLSFLQANSPQGTSSGYWSLDNTFNNASNTVVFIDSTLNNTAVTHLLEGDYQFVWTVSNGTCTDASDTVLVSAFDRPLPYAGTDMEFCAEDTVFLQANPAVGLASGEWTMDNNFPNPSVIVFDDSSVANTFTTGYIEGTYQFIWTISNGNCTPVGDTVQVTIYNQPIADAGQDIEQCALYTVQLDANSPVGTASGVWTEGDNFSNPSIVQFNDSSIYNTLSSDYVEGAYQLIWTMSNGVCPDSIDTVRIDIYDMPVANAGFDQFICDSDTVKMDGHGAVGTASGHWELDPNYVYPSIPTFRVPSDSATWVDGLIIGAYEMLWIVENGVCPSDTDRVLITNQETPVALAEYPLEVCDNKCFNVVSLSTTPPNTNLGLFWEIDGILSNDSVPEICLNQVGSFNVKLVVIASNGCKDSLLGNPDIEVHQSPVAGFELSYDTDTLIELQRVDIVDLASSDVVDYVYDMGTGDTLFGEAEPIYFFYNYGDYIVTQWVENQYGCRDSITLNQRVEKRGTVFVPNTFTPNGDGFNDGFAPVTRGLSSDSYEFAVFNRWGTMLFRSTEVGVAWDGRYKGEYVKDGVYLWRLSYKYENSDELFEINGHVNVYKYERE